MKDHSSVSISGKKTADDWKVTRGKLHGGSSADEWKRAFDDFLKTRLELRYLEPIRVIQRSGKLKGEGFLIATIQCSLIEFLESTVQGKNYRYLKKGEKLGAYEYSHSGAIFRDFLTKRAPFKAEFTKDIATDFYVNIRCGLLHEAQTKNGWLIMAKDPDGKTVDFHKKTLFRDNFQKALQHFVDEYGIELQNNTDYQAAFVRKFDKLCE